nr:histidine kinase [Burkholderia mayonis]
MADRPGRFVLAPGRTRTRIARAQLVYRIEEARANSDENHGLGLSIVKAVAEMHGGAVFVTCADGWNAIGFSVTARPADAEPQARDVRTAAAARQPTLKTT